MKYLLIRKKVPTIQNAQEEQHYQDKPCYKKEAHSHQTQGNSNKACKDKEEEANTTKEKTPDN